MSTRQVESEHPGRTGPAVKVAYRTVKIDGFADHFAEVNGVRLHYLIGGKGVR